MLTPALEIPMNTETNTTAPTPTHDLWVFNDEIIVSPDLANETIWMNQKQMCALYGRNKRTISEHLNNAFEESEIERDRTVRNFRTVQLEGGREVARDVEHYNLDAVLSVGYRVKSPNGTRFRQWATAKLKAALRPAPVNAPTDDDKQWLRNAFEGEESPEVRGMLLVALYPEAVGRFLANTGPNGRRMAGTSSFRAPAIPAEQVFAAWEEALRADPGWVVPTNIRRFGGEVAFRPAALLSLPPLERWSQDAVRRGLETEPAWMRGKFNQRFGAHGSQKCWVLKLDSLKPSLAELLSVAPAVTE